MSSFNLHPICCRFVLSALVACATLSTVQVALSADPITTSDSTLAQTLFEEGRRLMEAKQVAEACPKFEESQRLRPGTGTLLNLALCNEAIGKTATAWGQFKEVLFASKRENNEAREAFAKQHIDALEPKLSKLQINAESTPGLVIKHDNQEIPAAALGTPIPVDPGDHTLEATAPGYSVWSTSITVSDNGGVKNVAIPKLTPLTTSSSPITPSIQDSGSGNTQRTVGFVVGGVGVVAVGVGAILGIVASGDVSNAEQDPTLCPNKQCTPLGREAIDAASTKALVSTLGIGVGVAAIGAGVVLILTSSSSNNPTSKDARKRGHQAAVRILPALGPRGAVLSLSSRF